MTKYSKKAIRMVTEQVINMYSNNVLDNNGCEGFVGWCEDGDVFDGTDEEVAEATALMNEVAPMVDDLTYGYLNLDGFGACEGGYRVWADSDSSVVTDNEFDTLDEAHDWASKFVHKYDGKDAERVILHIDNADGMTVDTVENLNKCDIW